MYIDRRGNYHKKPEGTITINRESAYGILVANSKILLVKPTWIDIWEFPGGGKEQGESLIECMKREFLEESGFEILEYDKEAIRTIDVKFYAEDLNEYFDSRMSFFMIRRVCGPKRIVTDKKEIKEVNMFPVSELNNKNMNIIHLNVLEELKRSGIIE